MWCKVEAVMDASDGSAPVKLSEKELWQKPMRGWYKVNTDAAWHKSEQTAGVGVVIRDDEGRFMAGMSKPVGFEVSPTVVDALAVREGLRFAREIGFRRLVVETDAKVVVEMVKSWENREDEVGAITDALCREASRLLNVDDGDVIRYCRRTANEAAHIFAKWAQKLEVGQSWLEEEPHWARIVLHDDVMALYGRF